MSCSPIELRQKTKVCLLEIKIAEGKKKLTIRSECPEEVLIHQRALQLESEGLDYTLEYLNILEEVVTLVKSHKIPLAQCFENLKVGKIGWNSVVYDPYVEAERKSIVNLTKPIEVEVGIYKCPKCKSMKTQHYSRQMRGADEPSTTFITCANSACQYKWKMN